MASSQNRLVYQSGKLFLQDSERSQEFEVNIIGDLLVTGNLSVLGDADQVNVQEQTLQVTDTQIFLNYGEPRVGDQIVQVVDGNTFSKRVGIIVDRGLFRKSEDTPADRAIAAAVFPDATLIAQADPDDGTMRLYDNDTGQMVLLPKNPADRSQPYAFNWVDSKHAWSFESVEFPTDLDGTGSYIDYPGDPWVAPRLLDLGSPQLPSDAEIPTGSPIDPHLKASNAHTTLIDTSIDTINIEHPDYDGQPERLIYNLNTYARSAVNVEYLNKYAQEVTSVFTDLKLYTAFDATNKAQDYILQYDATTGFFEHRPLEIHYDTTPTLGGHLDTAGFRVDYNSTDYLQTFGTSGINVNLAAGHSLVLSTNASLESNTGLPFDISSNDGDINLVANSAGTSNGDILIKTSNAGTITLEDTTSVTLDTPTTNLTGQLSINGYGFKSPAAGTPVIYQMPPTDGAVGQVLLTDGAGNLSFSNLSLEASKWENARTITLAGDTTGNVTIDGTADATLTVTVLNDSHSHTSAFITDATPNNTANMIVKRDGSGNFSAGTITANLTGIALNSTNANLTAANATNATHYLSFSSTATGFQPLKTDTGLSYNPSTNTLSTTIFDGQATNSDKVNLVARETSLATHYIPFSAGTTGNQTLYTDTGVTYNASSNTIFATNFDGLATNSTQLALTAKTAVNTEQYMTMSTTASGQSSLGTHTGVTYNPSTETITAANFKGQALNSTNVNVLPTADNTAYSVNFSSASGNTRIRSDAGITYNPSTNTLVVPNITGTVTDTDAVNLTAADTLTSTQYVTFATGATGTQPIKTDTGLTYTPSTNTLSATNFNGQALNATNINILNSSSDATLCYLTFTSGATGNQRPRADVDLVYTPSTNTISCAFFDGQATNATNVTLLDDATTNSSHYVPFSVAGTGNNQLKTESTFRYNPSTNTLSAVAFDGQATNATNVNLVNTTDAVSYFIPFSSSETGNNRLRTNASIKYVPSTGTLSVPNFDGLAARATKLETPRTITLAGDVTGNTSFDGTANVTITATVGNNSHTHTSANISDATNLNTPNMIVKRDASGNFVAGTITADLTGVASRSTTSVATATNTGTHMLSMVNGSGHQGMLIDTDLTYNAATNTLTVANINGNISSATLAATATNVNAVAANTTNATHYLTFTSAATGSTPIKTDTGLSYNPSTNTLTVGSISGNISSATKLATARTISLTGDVSGSTTFDGTANVAITAVVANNSHTHTSANITDATNLNTPNMIVKRDGSGNFVAGTITANLSGNASSASTVAIGPDGSAGADNFVTFVPNSTGNNRPSADGSFIYNPGTNTLTVPNIVGTITNATNSVNATNSTNVNLLADDSSATDHYLLFSTSSTSGNNRIKTGSKIKFNPSTGTLSGVSVSGGSGSADKLSTARTIALSGDVTGSTSFDGSANVTISATVANNSHTHTSANISDATNANTANKIVKRDASGNFSAGTITASLNGTADVATNANVVNSSSSTATYYPNFSSLSGAQWIRTDSAMSYVPSTNTLTVPNINSNVTGNLTGIASRATQLNTPRTINGTSFNGTANITTSFWGPGRNLTIGNRTETVNGSADINWTLAEIGAVDKTGDTMTGALNAPSIGVNNTSNSSGNGLSLYGTYGTGMPSYGIAFAGTASFGKHGAVTGDWATYFTMAGSTSRGWVFKSGNGSGGNVASISATGVVTGSSFNSTSSRRYKSDIVETEWDFAENVLKLRPVRYTMDATGNEEFGFIAEEVNELYPEIVPKNEDGECEAVDYSRLVAPLTAKVQLQEEEIKDLKAELAEMKEMLSQLLKK